MGFRTILAASSGWISARVDTVGRISSLITDGNFSVDGNLWYQNNTRQHHVTGALLMGRRIHLGRGIGLAWSGYQYDREWWTREGWSREGWMRPALRAGRTFHYPECWFTQPTAHGGLAFLHAAWQCQADQKPKPAAVGGWILPLDKQSDISLRGYIIHPQFRPPQGLFNQLMSNCWSVSATYARGTTGKRSLRWAAELRQPLWFNADLERPLYHKQQILWETSLPNNLLFHCLWQWNNQANIQGWESFLGVNNPLNPSAVSAFTPTGLPVATVSTNTVNPLFNLIHPLPMQTTTNSNHKFTLNLRSQPSKSLTVEYQFTLVPRPHSAQGSYLCATTLVHRKPFSPLKWAAECIAFDSQIPLYFTPQTLPHEITHYTLSKRGIAINAQIQYTLKQSKSHQSPNSPISPKTTVSPQTIVSSKTPKAPKTSITPIKKNHNHPRIHLAARSEIILKNTTENPVQPRIFVALWLK